MSRNSNVVQESSDYEKFKFVESNRELSRGHVEALKQAFDEVGNMTTVQPLLVNNKFEIIDGQHRFVACMELGLPIFYTVVDGIGVREARSMNILHRSWRVMDFARSYAITGNKHYQKYLELKDDYGFGHSVLLGCVFPNNFKGLFKEFREGDFKLENEAETRERLNKLAQVVEVVPIAVDRNFAYALVKVMKIEGYDHNRMVKKLRLHTGQLKKFTSIEDSLRQLEHVYNYAMPEASRLRLY